MNIAKNVKAIIGKDLEEKGFVYKKDGNVWLYERKKGDVTQSICIIRDRYFAGYIKAVLYADAYGQEMREFRNFVPEVMGTFQEFWEYKTEEELKQVLEQFRIWINTYGLSLLESMSVPTTEARPKPETNLYLYQHHEEIYEKYRKEWKLEGMTGTEVMERIQEEMEKLYDRDFKEIEGKLIELAAVYGHTTCIDGIGEWEWEERRKICWVRNAGGRGRSVEPLEKIILSYVHRALYFKKRYETLMKCRPTLKALKQKKQSGE